MAVERVDYSTEEEYQQALLSENECEQRFAEEARQKECGAEFIIAGAKEKYRNDPMYHKYIDTLAWMLFKKQFTLSDCYSAITIADEIAYEKTKEYMVDRLQEEVPI